MAGRYVVVVDRVKEEEKIKSNHGERLKLQVALIKFDCRHQEQQ